MNERPCFRSFEISSILGVSVGKEYQEKNHVVG